MDIIMTIRVPYCFLFVIYTLLPVIAQSAPEVRLPDGIVKGSDKEAVTTNLPYHAYYGIPFAAPPVGGLRFKPPQRFITNDPNRVISTNSFRPQCIQPNDSDEQSEDCLYLNVFTPNTLTGQFDGQPLKKVMVWIHGGGYTDGSASFYSPARMVTDYDVIVVTIQYRLGILGFLSSGDDSLPGNLGLRDQIEAIRWTKDNIGRFGGDGSDITIFGESAGGASVSILSISPLTKGLFTKAIVQSGTALSPWAMNKKPTDKFYQVARDNGCTPWFYFPGIKDYYNRRIVECLEKLPVESFVEKEEGDPASNGDSKFDTKDDDDDDDDDEDSKEDSKEESDEDSDEEDSKGGGGDSKKDMEQKIDPRLFDFTLKEYVAYAPVVDGDLIPKHPKILLADKDYLRRNGVLDRKYIIGANNNEALLFVEYLFTIFGSELPDEFYDEALIESGSKAVVSEFFGLPVTSDLATYVDLMYNYPRDEQGKPPVQGRLDMITDSSYIVPTVQFANALAEDADVYLYLFDYYPVPKDPNSPSRGSTHALDIFYVFDEIPELSDILLTYAYVYTPSSIPVMRYFRSLFTNLANFGSPSGNGNTATWPRYTLGEQKYLAIDEVAEVRERLYAHRVSLWTEFLPRKYKNILFN